jgi:hypothetical protein
MDVRSRVRALALGAAALLITLSAQAQTQRLVLKETLEASAGMINMPSTQDGMMTVTTCSTCPAKILRSTAKTVYMLRDVQVPYATFRQAIANSSDTYVSVQFAKNTQEVLNVTASIAPPASGTP